MWHGCQQKCIPSKFCLLSRSGKNLKMPWKFQGKLREFCFSKMWRPCGNDPPSRKRLKNQIFIATSPCIAKNGSLSPQSRTKINRTPGVWQSKDCFFPLYHFQCCSCVVENFKIHVDLQHWFGRWGERENGLTEQTRFCKNFEKYVRNRPDNFVQNCRREQAEKYRLTETYVWYFLLCFYDWCKYQFGYAKNQKTNNCLLVKTAV